MKLVEPIVIWSLERREFREGLTANPEPSLSRNTLEGAETRTHEPERFMKSVGYSSESRSAVHPTNAVKHKRMKI
jgi:hypothetical protein